MLFITLLSPKGKGADAVKHLKTLKTPKGITIREVFFTFGRYDGIIIFEAVNEGAAMKFIMQTGFNTNYTMETLVAVPTNKI
ncbi:MAG: GYD domain-containing protein [Candidatus Bathyarchaeota archaeon]|nr:GYD domain-containing protein [Candidatus Bathyarchaeota archaeon]